MSLVIHAGALKGAAPRVLKAAVAERLDGAEGLTPELQDCVDALQAAANKLIARAPAGKRIDVQLLLAETPFGGLELSVAMSATRAPTRRGRRAG